MRNEIQILGKYDEFGKRKSKYRLAQDRHFHARLTRKDHPLDKSGDEFPTLTDYAVSCDALSCYREELTPTITATLMQKSLHIPSAARHLLLRVDAWHAFSHSKGGQNPLKRHPETDPVPRADRRLTIQIPEWRITYQDDLTAYLMVSREKLTMLQVIGEALDMEVTYREILIPEEYSWSYLEQRMVETNRFNLPPWLDGKTAQSPRQRRLRNIRSGHDSGYGLFRRYIFNLVKRKEKRNDKE